MISIKIDLDKCTGCASCNVLYKEVFNYDEAKEKAVVSKNLSNVDMVKVMKAAAECPSKAISVFDEKGVQILPSK